MRASISVKNTKIGDVINTLLMANHLAKKIVNDNTMLIYPDTPNFPPIRWSSGSISLGVTSTRLSVSIILKFSSFNKCSIDFSNRSNKSP